MEFTDLLFSLIVLTALEIILGIDNLIFLTIVSQKLPAAKQAKARQIGLTLAWMMRLLMLATAIWLTKLVKPIVVLFGFAFSGRDLFLLAGGMFLLFKATQEIHLELEDKEAIVLNKTTAFSWVVTQIVFLDLIFSLDSILTAIGLTQNFWLMAIAITIAIICMIFASEPLSSFVEKHPTIKMLALTFLMLIGIVLIADAFQFHIPRGYIYFGMLYSISVEMLNLFKKHRAKKKSQIKS